jgi:hypothetical protein
MLFVCLNIFFVCLFVSIFLFDNNLCLFKVPTAMELATPAANVPAKEDLPVEIAQLGEF